MRAAWTSMIFSTLLFAMTSAAPQEQEKRFGYWGYRHMELHMLGVIEELQKRTNSKCCNGLMSGECRVTTVDLPRKTAYIDGLENCPLDSNTRITALESLSKIKEPGKAVAVVCAGRSFSDHGVRHCPVAYCVGVQSGQ